MNFGLQLLVALGSTHCVHFLIHQKKVAQIRAATGFVLFCFGLAMLLGLHSMSSLAVYCYGGTFVAMSEPRRLKEKWALVASVAFVLVFQLIQNLDFLKRQGSIGGTLGLSAFLACSLIYILEIFILKLWNNLKQR